MKKRTRKNDGFTLIEVAVVVAIVGVISAIAIAGYLSWKPGNVFRSAVSQVQNDLNRAKMRAVETRKQCRVSVTANGYQIEDGNRGMNSDDWGNVDSNGIFTSGVPFRSEDFSHLPQVSISIPAPVIFSPRGTAGMGSMNVVHSSIGTASITVNITGRINISWP